MVQITGAILGFLSSGTVEIGSIDALFDGEMSDHDALDKVTRFKQVAEFGAFRMHLPDDDDRFFINETRLVNVQGYSLTVDSLQSGSIKSKLKILMHVSFVVYTGVAAYDDFASMLPRIQSGFSGLLDRIELAYSEYQWVLTDLDEEPSPGQVPRRIEYAVRRDEEIIAELLEMSQSK